MITKGEGYIQLEVSPAKVDISASMHNDNVTTRVNKDITVSRRMRRTTYQARLGSKLDGILAKISDNNIRLTSNPTDMIRVTTRRDEFSQDVLTKKITSVEVVPIVLPVMKDIPLRKFTRKGEDCDVLAPSLYPIAEEEYFEIYSPLEVQLDEDDLLIRIIHDSYAEEPYVMCLQVKEILATLGYSGITRHKYYATFYDEKLPPVVISYIKNSLLKRSLIKY